MASVKRLVLNRLEYRAVVGLAGEESEHAIGALMRSATGITDLRVKDTKPGDTTVLYFESESFPVNPCCWLLSAPEWPEGAAALHEIAGADSLRTSGPGPGTAGPAPQGGTP